MEGFVYFPERFRKCVPFRLAAEFGYFRTGVGRGSGICRNEQRRYLAYGITFQKAMGGPRTPVPEEPWTFLAIPWPTDRQRPPPHEYYTSRLRFQFVAVGPKLAFQTTCEETPVPVQRGSFVPIV